MSISPLLVSLEKALRCLPGVGPRSASRMALHLLERDRERGLHLAATLTQALEQIEHCEKCQNLTEIQPCRICQDDTRDQQLLCVVSSPSDILAIEQSGLFQGRYHCLSGLLSPLDGLGPNEIGLSDLVMRVEHEQPTECLVALASTVEGEATTHQIVSQLRSITRITRLAQGVPVGGELDHLDISTLSQALASRTEIQF
ncbi:MAG TPA: recombination protein RecR [Gammaproteobacteria bacterium]|jgi:recombination protein RecR|nr:recombination mediator RecR [Litorivicinaceae bacterium]NBR75306.1 recombination protein RecR [Gammaproteobacteria bacterium]HAY54591.1 recombination protein RecR [Gammaproteobacteria bacterium]